MSLTFAYKELRMPHPVVALSGRSTRPRPLVHISLVGQTGVYLREALLDIGADDTVFPVRAARQAGINLSRAPVRSAVGVGGIAFSIRYARVTLRLTDGVEFREWPAIVGFTSAPLRYPLLGFAGCLQYFTACFHGDLEKVELTVNPLYPGR